MYYDPSISLPLGNFGDYFLTVCDILGPFQTFKHNFEQTWIFWDSLGPFVTVWINWDKLETFGTIYDHLGSSGKI